MNRYLILVPGGDDFVPGLYPNNYRLKGIDAWVVGSEESTCADVWERLMVPPPGGWVVISIGQYYGRYDRALWDKLTAWRDADD